MHIIIRVCAYKAVLYTYIICIYIVSVTRGLCGICSLRNRSAHDSRSVRPRPNDNIVIYYYYL